MLNIEAFLTASFQDQTAQNVWSKLEDIYCQSRLQDCKSILFYVSAATSLFETLREKEKLLVTSNFSSSHSVFYPVGDFH